MGVSIYEFRDLDLMAKLSEQGSGATSGDLADELGLRDDNGRQAIGTRLAWMRRFGMLDFNGKERKWSLSRGGERVMVAQRKAALKGLIDEMPEGELIEAMAYIASRYRMGEPYLANLLRREFIFGTHPRSVLRRLP